MKQGIKIIVALFTALLLLSCGSSKRNTSATTKGETRYYNPPEDRRLIEAVNDALTYEGTGYKWGGTTRAGMDCSGLVYTTFGKVNIQLPRVSRNMAREGTRIKIKKATIGDLLFFKTDGSSRINHVGIIVDIRPGKMLFIHSTTSQGVIISSMDERYWEKAFTEARRMI